MSMKRREFLAAGLALNFSSAAVALAQQGGATPDRARSGGGAGGAAPRRMAKTTKMFKSPGLYPNALAVMTDAPGGLWIGQQKVTAQNAQTYNLPVDPDRDEDAWLVDWNGKLLKTVKTHSRNTSGMAYGNGFIWMGANAAPQGIFQTDMSSKTITHRQIPLGPKENGGGCHGVEYVNGKLWIAALRLRGILRVDAKTWEPELLIPYSAPRAHGSAFDKDAVWLVTGDERGAGLVKYDATTGRPLEIVEFGEDACDPHGLAWHNGVLYSCDAGIHPGWPENKSPTHGYVFKIEIA